MPIRLPRQQPLPDSAAPGRRLGQPSRASAVGFDARVLTSFAPTIGMPESHSGGAGAPMPLGREPARQRFRHVRQWSPMASPSGKTSKSSMASVMMATAGPGGRRVAPAATSAAAGTGDDDHRRPYRRRQKRPQDPERSSNQQNDAEHRQHGTRQVALVSSWGTLGMEEMDTASYRQGSSCCRARPERSRAQSRRG